MAPTMGIQFVIQTTIFLASLLEKCGCDDDALLVWSGETKASTILQSLRGNPYDYLYDIADDKFEATRQMMWHRWQPLNSSLYSRLSFDYMSNSVAIVDQTTKKIIISPFRKIKNYYSFNNLPLSDNVSGVVLLMKLNMLFWVDSLHKYIGVMQLSIKKWTKIIHKDVDVPFALAAHSTEYNLYWSDIGSSPRIETSKFNGRGRRVIVSSGLNRPIGLEVDKQYNRLFWLDDGDLKSVNLRSGRVRSYGSSDHHNYDITSFSIYRDVVLFGTEQGICLGYKIQSLLWNQSLISIVHFVINPTTRITSIAIGSKSIEDEIPKNPCRGYDCSDICIPLSEKRYSCRCPFGYLTAIDTTNCNSVKLRDGRLLVVDRKQARLYQVDPYFSYVGVILEIPESSLENAVYFVYQQHKFIFFVDTNALEIMKYDVTTMTTSSFVAVDSRVTDMTMDLKTGVIYVVVNEKRIIRIHSPGNRTIFANISRGTINRIHIEETQQTLFYSDCQRNELVELNLTDLKLLNVYSLDDCVHSMFVDAASGIAYLGLAGNNLIQYNMEKRRSNKNFHRANNTVTDITMLHEFLYYVDNSSYLVQVNPTTSEWRVIRRGSFTQASLIRSLDFNLSRALPAWISGSPATESSHVTTEASGQEDGDGGGATDSIIDVTFERPENAMDDDITHATVENLPEENDISDDDTVDEPPHVVVERSPKDKPFTFGTLLPNTDIESTMVDVYITFSQIGSGRKIDRKSRRRNKDGMEDESMITKNIPASNECSMRPFMTYWKVLWLLILEILTTV